MKVVKSNYQNYFEIEMEKKENLSIAKDIKIGKTSFYQVKYKDNEYIMDLIIDIGSEASLKLYGKEFLIPNLYEKILYELSKDYNTLKLTIFNEDSGLSELIKSKSNVIEIKELEKSTFKEYIYLIDLTNIDDSNISDDFKIEKYSYEKYIKYQEDTIKNRLEYNNLKLGLDNFYEIYDEESNLITSFIVQRNYSKNHLQLNERLYFVPNLLKNIFKELKKDYEHVSLVTFSDSHDTIKQIKSVAKNYEEVTIDPLNKIGLTTITINF